MDHDQTPAVIAGRYRLEGPAALPLAGAIVQTAHDDILDRKILVVDVSRSTHSDGTPVDSTTVLDAARRASLIADQRLVKLLDVGEDDGVDYIATEAPAGISLTDLIAQGPLDGPAARALVAELSTALEEARKRGVHHQLLRPELVFVDKRGVRLYGLGFASALVGAPEVSSEAASRTDADGLIRLLSYCVTGVWPSADAAGPPALDPDDVLVEAESSSDEVAADGAPASTEEDSVAQTWGETPGAIGGPLGNSRSALVTFAAAALSGLVDFETPGEIGQALRPWKKSALISAVRSSLAAFDSEVASVGGTLPDGESGPSGVNRQSTRSSTGQLPAAAATVFTPPPAIPPRKPLTNRFFPSSGGVGASASGPAVPVRVASGVAAGSSAASLLSPVFSPEAADPPVPVFTPVSAGGSHGSSPEVSATQGSASPSQAAGQGTRQQQLKGLRFNPTKIVLLLTVLAVIFAGTWAVNALTGNLGPTFATKAQNSGATATTPPSTDAAAAPSSTSTTATLDPPVIMKGVQVDPDGDGGEHPEMAKYAYDQDLQTMWMSLTYSTSSFGGYNKRGIGYAVTLEKATLVSTVYLTTENTGGTIQIRDTTAKDPTGGTLLAKSTFNGDFEIQLSTPTVTDHLVIWVTDLPKNAAGKYSLRIAEISLS